MGHRRPARATHLHRAHRQPDQCVVLRRRPDGAHHQRSRPYGAALGRDQRTRDAQFHGPNDSRVNSAAFSAGSEILASGHGRGDKRARTWDLGTGTVLQTFQHEANVIQAVYSPDGQTVLTASLDKTARLWNAATGQLHTLQGDIVDSVAYAPDGKRS